jgi:hypothetical protein
VANPTIAPSGVAVVGFSPPQEYDGSSLEVSILLMRRRRVTFPPSRGWRATHLELEGGGGLSLDRVRGEDQTASGRRSSLFLYDTLHLGAVAIVSGRFRPVLRGPLSLEAGLSHHQIWLSAWAEEDWHYDPYCGSVGLRGAWIGTVFQSRR